MDPRLGLALLLGYVLLCAESFLATHAVGVFRISFSGIGPTELRILLSIGATCGRLPADRDAVRAGAGGAVRPERGSVARRDGDRLRRLDVAQRAHAVSGGAAAASPFSAGPSEPRPRASSGSAPAASSCRRSRCRASPPPGSPTRGHGLAVEAAILHNFLWHERWTWSDRAAAGRRLDRLAAFQRHRGPHLDRRQRRAHGAPRRVFQLPLLPRTCSPSSP